MSRNQQSIWHKNRHQQDILSAKSARLELVSERAEDLELCTAETLLPTQEELTLYRRLYENIPSVYFSLDITGIILSVNKFGANSLGYSVEELIDQSVLNLFEHSDKQKLSDALGELVKTASFSEVSKWELRLNCPVSEIVWVKVVARLLPADDGFSHLDLSSTDKHQQKHPQILMVLEDITTHKQAEDALRESEQRFHSMANTAPVMLWMTGCDGLFTFFNQSWLKFTGRSMEQQQGLGWLEGVHPQEQDFCQDIYDSAFHARAKFEMEYRLKRHDNEYRWVLDTGIPRFTPNGKFVGYIGCCIDITERKSAEVALKHSQESVQAQLEEMESLNRLKDEFLSTVSHELRTPLTNMKMAIQMLGIALNQEQNFFLEMEKPQTERSKAARYYDILDNECDREINLISNFLDLQRLDNNTKPLVLETVQVQQWLWRVVELFKARNRNSCQQKLRLSIANSLPLLTCDPFSLERILIELLTNACKFSPPDAEITISAQMKSQNMQFQVINSGVEIPSYELPRIFDKFYRIPSNDPWKQGGTGLGLALVQKLTKLLGGTIEVESGSNRTCFAIQLPLSNEV
ncbi:MULTISPECIES: sensor histidine kinase [unclassified Tolypothrix]|uniref:sensor histidine kinase n=1 Tax=unclassified Tolypothrix TaxID=2649714 RepID=UPI0005EAA88D|nr:MULTISPECIES: PAS domain-containing sensor histidine kinase [unclassified Tolypothrix]BAY94028.1 two-component sensor histidine kinase [Microchaete diplosiphon NIES-3275]EKF03655.1 sensor histidine kinase [Tolypothrix sp. PCC 7601]MBE9081809.1 PAS domain-containing sensor histidine kinase [Tolypothrix sp. LEGE 11397]UYD27800.1 PAS domain-containing sensor histidine kinase [Tolypothrix sp. PCC 7712]UYD36336.1 PAS domain-containing sensor histidine kinase [Tolypothrix sp. PCC 7601]